MLLPILSFLAVKESPQKAGWTSTIRSRNEFNRLARTTDLPYRLSHIRFLIDRQQRNRIYYIDSKHDQHHREFAKRMYLSLQSDEAFFATNTTQENRRFLLGWVTYHPPVKRWTYEFWDGDQLSPVLLRIAQIAVVKSFFAPVVFKPNSVRQEDLAVKMNQPRILLRDIVKSNVYQPLNLGFAVGRLRVIRNMEEVADAAPDEILVLPEAPAGTPPVAGLVFAGPTTPVSHLGLLARGWRIPSATILGAIESLRPWEGQIVAYRTEAGEYHIHPAEPDQLRAWERSKRTRPGLSIPKLDFQATRLSSLLEQRATDSLAYGSKSANLGEIARAAIPGVVVPRGFTIPFSAYIRYLQENGLNTMIKDALADPATRRDAKRRRARLEEIRERFAHGVLDRALVQEVLDRAKSAFGERGVFVRSSTNSEDLPNFSGAGLYTTVPNVKGEAALLDAIRTVWASVWNEEAYLARERAGIDHTGVAMAVLIQEGVPSESSGVLITSNPFDSGDPGAVYISAKRGLGISVVEGRRVPEQIIFRKGSNAVQVLTRSDEESQLTFDPKGGLVEVPAPSQRAVLTDDLVRRLSVAGLALQRVFGGKTQDVEWAVVGEQIFILQARPYVAH